MVDMPSSANLPTVDTLPPEAVQEMAVAYLDLLRLMTESLEACDTGYAFFWWSGRGFHITGHPPTELVDLLRENGADRG